MSDPIKTRPILFNAAMVRALLAGTKTQTRRVVKHQPPDERYQLATCMSTTGDRRDEGRHHWLLRDGFYVLDGSGPYFSCPYGQPGDRLWVREAWAFDEEDNRVLYRADDNEETKEWDQARAESGLSKYRWRPSIHMPRVAGRTTLEIVSMRVEPLQDISEEDALAEGVGGSATITPCFAIERYRALWESINGPGSWDANPFVWVVEFKRVEAAA